MNKRLIVALVVAFAVLYLGLAAAADTVPSAPMAPLADPTIPTPTGGLAVKLTQGPDPLCPGWNLYYTLMMTNTSTTQTFTGVVVSDRVPAGTWVHEPELGGAIPGVYDSAQGVITWNVGQISPGQTSTVSFLLRTYSSLPNGMIISNTMTYSATELAQAGQVSDGATIDDTICGATPTPSSTPTATPTATPTKPAGWALIPLVTK